MTVFELHPEGSRNHVRAAESLVWPVSTNRSDTVQANINPWLCQLGIPGDAAVDLVRIATGAYLTDRLVKRQAGFSRTIDLHVQVTDIRRWDGPLEDIADLLFWLSGDTWNLEVSNEAVARPEEIATVAPADAVSLLSGGLDSFCGATLSNRDQRRVFLGHWDSTTVKHSQNQSWTWLTDEAGVTGSYRQVHLCEVQRKLERSTRTRSFLFMALATALASATGAGVVEVPENGFTSLNPAFGADRGGALSTRSTHPTTLQSMNLVINNLGIDVDIRDLFSGLTKGELMAAAVGASPASFPDGAAQTSSCSKLDGNWYSGGNVNHNCGLCVPCFVRRGAFIAANVADPTLYLCDYLTGDALQKLHMNRAKDINAVRYILANGISDTALMAAGPYPDDFDVDYALALCSRALDELRGVPLP
jgi:7-cyano-7-deazaguanine synthase in queuosine biosynthesis